MKTKRSKPHQTLGLISAIALAGSPAASAAVVAQYSFEGNLNDTAAGGGTADTLTYGQGTSGSATPQYIAGVPGLGGQAALFDGNFFSATNSPDLDINSDTWTIETFVHVTTPTANWHRLVLKWDSSTEYHFALESQDFNLFEGAGNSQVFDANTAPATDFTDGWHHLAVTSSPTGSQAWIDGVSVFTGGAITLPSGTDNLGLGDNSTGAFPAFRHLGWMDEVRIHNTAVDQNYINGRAALLVPEPSAFALALGSLALLLRRRR